MRLQIQRTITIAKPSSDVFTILSDLKQWNTWSPWFQCEPTVKTTVLGQSGQVGQTQDWEGEVVGAGKLTITELQQNKMVGMTIEFFKPWKNIAEVNFVIEAMGAQHTKLTWTMNSQMPWFMFFLRNMMVAYMSSDFDRGLRLLKEFLETGVVNSNSVYRGVQERLGFQVVGKKTSCRISELSTVIQKDFAALEKFQKQGALPKPESVVTLKHKFDIPKGLREFTAGYAYKAEQNLKVPAGLEIHQISPHKSLLVDFYGPYRNISNAWSMAMSYQRGKKMKLRKDLPMYESYKAMPDGRPEKDIHTEVVMPIK